MGKINILDIQSSNMIAAGEVVDRPGGALKELIENAIDAGASIINISIKAGGVTQISVNDNGSGLDTEDMQKALLRHATSKIKSAQELDGVGTLGFRGEALAAISSVSRFQMISSQKGGSGNLITNDENGVEISEVGCPAGTTVIVNDLFYNVPARRKFLKKDSTEGAYCHSVAAKLALSECDISFSFESDGVLKFRTSGSGDLLDAYYSIFGRQAAQGLLSVDYELNGVGVCGLISEPCNARASRSGQLFYINSRVVNSKTVMAALEEANRSYLGSGRFPAAVLFVELDGKSVDVNIHPAKTEVKFKDEKSVFSSVYYAVKNTLENLSKKKAEKAEQTVTDNLHIQSPVIHSETTIDLPKPQRMVFSPNIIGTDHLDPNSLFKDNGEMLPLRDSQITSEEKPAERIITQTTIAPVIGYQYSGEIFDSFLIATNADTVFFIDKHALHERIIYEKLKNNKEAVPQKLLTGVVVKLNEMQCETVIDNASLLFDSGFEIERFGDSELIIRSVPSYLTKLDSLQGIIEDFAAKLCEGNAISFADRIDRALFTVACKMALKAGIQNPDSHNKWLIGQFFENPNVRYCPHGRSVSYSIPKRDIEKKFDR